MDYKTILVLTDTSASSDARVACACQLAIEHDAHLIGVTQSGVYRLVYGSFDARSELGDIAPLFADLENSPGRPALNEELAFETR